MTRMRTWFSICAGLILAACSPGKSTEPSAGPAGAFLGTLVATGVSGVLTITFPASAASGLARRAHFSLVPVEHASAAPISLTGTLAITGGSTITLNGTYDASANPQLTVTGGGYTITGNYTATNDQFSGSFNGPGGVTGQWSVSAGGSTVRVFCGTYVGSFSGTLNLVLDGSNRLSGVVNIPGGATQLQGSYSPGSNPNVSVTFALDAAGSVYGSALGSLDPSTGAAGGGWSIPIPKGTGGEWWVSTTLCSPPPPDAKLFGVSAEAPTSVLTVGEAGTILYYDGNSWSHRASGTTKTLYAMGPGRVVVGAEGTILQYIPTTLSWSPQTSGTTNALYQVARGVPGAASGALFAVGDAGTILYYNGTSWSAQNSGTASRLDGVAKVPNFSYDFAVGARGTILFYDGTKWALKESGISKDLFAVGVICFACGRTDAYAVGEGGTILHYDGTTWTAQNSGTANVLRGIDGLWAVGDGGTILHSPDYSTWTQEVSGTGDDLTSVSVALPDNIFAVGAKGTVLHFDGKGWTRQR